MCLDDEFEKDISIAIVGFRGVGKSSLAVLAANALGFGLIDDERHFKETTGMSRAAFVAAHGTKTYQEREASATCSMFRQNPRRRVIVCGPASVHATVQEEIREFAKAHPVIYVSRDTTEIDKYLRTRDTAMIQRLLSLADPTYRAISNFEFFNFSEPQVPDSTSEIGESGSRNEKLRPSHPTLVLKRVEEDFLALLRNIMGDKSTARLRDGRHTLSYLPPELKRFTYSLTLPVTLVTSMARNLARSNLLADAIELVIEVPALLACNQPGGKFEGDPLVFLTRQYWTLRREFKLPVIIHVVGRQSYQPSGNWPPERAAELDQLFLQLLRHSLRLAPEYIVLDLECEAKIRKLVMEHRGHTRIIGHFHDENPPEDGWKSPARMKLLEVAGHLGCNLVRISQTARTCRDNLALQIFLDQIKQSARFLPQVIAFNTGDLGRSSIFTNAIFTPVTHELIRESDQRIPWLLTVQEARNALYASFVLEKMEFFIFGSHVSMAMSPAMHNAAFQFCSLPHHYAVVQSNSLQNLRTIIQNPCFGGASITMPFKEEIMSVLDFVSPEAQVIGAVNTLLPLRDTNFQSLLRRNERGPVVAYFGDNTDWIGVYTCLRRNLSPINSVKSRTTGLVVGAGGMAKASIYAMIRMGIQNIFIHNRTIERAERVVSQFSQRRFALRNPSADGFLPKMPYDRDSPEETPPEHIGPATVHLLPSMDDPWPSPYELPTVVVACIPGKVDGGMTNLTLPERWLQSRTGGVAIEVSHILIYSTKLYGIVLTYYSSHTIRERPLFSSKSKHVAIEVG